jgi:hypothetical protein
LTIINNVIQFYKIFQIKIGQIPIEEYLLNEDLNPKIINKQTHQSVLYIQELAIRYLRPPTPPPPGDIIIEERPNAATPPAPPLIIRQQPSRPKTPEPLVIREAPPLAPRNVCRKLITISGKQLPPPPRKVIIERLAPIPSKPQSVIIERWLPYKKVKRRVIYQKSSETNECLDKPRNVIVQWEPPKVSLKKEYKYLGVVNANPAEYIQKYGKTLKESKELPSFVVNIKTPENLILAADVNNNTSLVHELEGDVDALRLVDLEKEGLSEYKNIIEKNKETTKKQHIRKLSVNSAQMTGRQTDYSLKERLETIFNSIDLDGNGVITRDEANNVLLRINSHLGRVYGENEANAFFSNLDTNEDGEISLNEFKNAFQHCQFFR